MKDVFARATGLTEDASAAQKKPRVDCDSDDHAEEEGAAEGEVFGEESRRVVGEGEHILQRDVTDVSILRRR